MDAPFLLPSAAFLYVNLAHIQPNVINDRGVVEDSGGRFNGKVELVYYSPSCAFEPHPSDLRSATFPRGEGFLENNPAFFHALEYFAFGKI